MLYNRNQLNCLSDEELMGLLAGGEQIAFDELYRRYATPLLNFFYRMLNHDRGRAEDLLHDLFLVLIEQPDRFDRSRRFSTWLYTIATNKLKNEYRSRQVRSIVVALDYNQDVAFQDDDNKEVLYSQLQIELEMMDPESQLLFRLRYNEEWSVKQIAGFIQCKEGTVKSRLHTLSRKLARKLIHYKPELE
jgi:RNA polymerase sigma-70 factor (ECF subfamily)